MPSITPRRRAGATAAVLAGALLLVSGCGLQPQRSGSSGGDASSLTVWWPGTNQAEMDFVDDTVVPAFEEETGAHVEVTFVDWADLSPKLNAAFAAGTAPDVFGHGPAAVADFVVNDRVEDLGPYVDRMDPALREDISASLPGGQVDGTQYLMPLSVQGTLVAYDADAFTEAGLDPDDPPTTWEGVRDAAERLTVRDGGTITRAGLLVPSNPLGAQQSFAGFLAAAGGAQLSDDGSTAAFDSPEGEQALDFFAGLYGGDSPVADMLGEDYVNMPPNQQPIVKGDAAMAVLTAPALQQAVEAAPDKDIRAMPPLRFEDSDTPAMWGGAGPGLMINADSPAKDLGWDFIADLLAPDVSGQYTERIGAVPVHASAVDSEYVRSSPVIAAFVAASPSFVPNPNVPGWTGVRDALDARIAEALFGTADPSDALSDAADQVDSLLDAG
ncbi:extracellular solute-binding protein [Streptomyces sp. RFCAC02]|uniref:extracellular solute-binding protein n=1 Tax=Streptomyces sp. RFCAC02 TaxID=2499143 RepID=UPI00102204CC|nr:extracellular solute-binding protein [Streptomyces sp. RFCAC02]